MIIAKSTTKLPRGKDWVYELKYDGWRALASVKSCEVKLMSRNDNELDFPAIKDSLLKLGRDVTIDGEVIAIDKDGRCDFHAVRSKRDLVYMVFDILMLDGTDLRGLPYLERKKKLKNIIKNAPPNIRYVEHMTQFSDKDFDKLCKGNFEGIIAKNDNSWLKIKCPNYTRKTKDIEITSPDKIVFREPDITKQQIVDYYTAIAPRMLPYLRGRNIALIKCPSGVDAHCFYNKNQDDGLITISTAKELVKHVQMNTIEFHTWGFPDMMVFDLDPDEGLGLKHVRQGVRDLKSVLDELRLKSYLKTSGGKGYHVVVPFTRGAEHFRDFSKTVALYMEQRWHKRYTTNVRKINRRGKVFIDWMRNTRGATSVAPYSIRARKGAPVSCPIAWEELSNIAPADIDMDDAIKRLGESDPWGDILK